MLKKYSSDKNEKADIVFWKAKGIPRFIIEIKRSNSITIIKDDAIIIRDVMKAKSEIEGGIIVQTNIYKGDVEKKFCDNYETIQDETSFELFKKVSGFYKYSDSYWGSGIFYLKK